ncbi:hypothetical protein ACHAXT_011042 [Thalassiosira profunda]
MPGPPEFLRTVLDGASEASCVVLASGAIWHMNGPARRLFQVVDGHGGAPVSTYLSFSTAHAPGQQTLPLSWDQLIDPDAFANNRRAAEGIGMSAGGGRVPLTITVVKVAGLADAPEEMRSGQSSASDTNRRQGGAAYYCLYIQVVTPAVLQMDSLRAEVALLSAKNDEGKNINLGILDASFDALFVIDNCGIIQQVNETSTEVFGWTRAEFIGQNISMIMTSDVAANHDQYLQNYLRTGIKKMIGTQREVTAQRKDKTTFPCVLGLSQARETGLFCGFIRNISSEKAHQSETLAKNLRMEKILDASFDALFVINSRGIIQDVNEKCTTVFGWTREEFIGQNISMIMPEGHAKRHDSYLEAYIRTGFKKMIGKQREVEAKRKDGTCFPCILGLSEVTNNGVRECFVGFIKDVTVQKSLMIAKAEQEASEELLHNILPEHIAHRLKQDPSHIADHYENTTILFADIVGFTDRANRMSPHDVVTMLNDLFGRFDFLVDRYDVNKVKTIGDCYMVTSIPSGDLEHDGCARVCRFALDLMKAVNAFNEDGPLFGHIELRVGIACGPVVAGVVGTKRFLFDMWGDAVNVAARMEQHGLPGKIQVTKEVVDNAGSDFSFDRRGPLTVKGKGVMQTYILTAAKPRHMRRSVHSFWKPSSRPPSARANSDFI